MNFPYQLLNGRHQVQKFKSVDSGSKMTHLPYFEHKRCTNSPEFPHPVLHFGLNKKFPQKNVLIEPLLHVKKNLKNEPIPRKQSYGRRTDEGMDRAEFIGPSSRVKIRNMLINVGKILEYFTWYPIREYM